MIGYLAHRLFVLSLVIVLALRLLNIEQQLQQANSNVLHAHTQERRRLARDVHDGIGQWLSTIKLNLQLLKANKHDEKIEQRYDELVDNVAEAIKETRTVAHDLSPALLEKQGLIGAIRSHADRVQDDKSVQIEIIADDDLELSKFASEHLYRVFQEAIRNAIVHGRADKIEVKINFVHDNLLFSIQDNGIGMQTKQRETGQHMGLTNITERVTMLNGEFTLNNVASGGVEVLIHIPKERCVD